MKHLTMLSRGALLALLMVSICACQAAAPAPQQTTIEGMLVLKGSLPHAVPVLQTTDGNWELIGADLEQVKHLQRQRVVVTGSAIASEPPQRKRLRVEQIEPLTND